MKEFVAALGEELSLTTKEIADIIWLAVQMGELPQPATSDSSQSLDIGKSRSPQQIDPPIPKDPIDLPNPEPSPPPAEIHPVDRSNLGGGLAISVPDARSLREPLELARSLKPLLQRVASGWSNVLDEEATILKIDREQIWLPVLKPNLEAWLDLVLVVDESVSMQIWQRTISELQRFLAHYGVFRDVRVYSLVVENERAYVRPRLGAALQGQSLRNPQELIDPSGRRLILVATDCVAGFWRSGEVLPALKLWAKSGPMAIVQMLPEWLWGRSGLGLASAVRFAALQAGIPNHQLKATNLSLWDDVDLDLGIKVPVVTLEPVPMKTWAQLVAGKGDIQSPGFVFDSEPMPSTGEEQSRTEGLFAGAGSGAERVRRFQVTASPMARQLAMILAAAPTISLPIVRILQDRLLPRSQQVHVAEVFLGGLLKPLVEVDAQSNPDLVPYEFMDGARDVLLDSVPTTEVVNVMQQVSQFVAERLGLTLDAFMGVLRNPQETGDLDVVSQSRPFALVTAQILRKLGGGYAQLAQELEQANRQDPSVETDSSVNNQIIIDKTFLKLFPPSDRSQVDWEWGMKLLKQKQLPAIRKRLTDILGRDRLLMDVSIEEQQNWVNRPPLIADLMLQIDGKDCGTLDANKMLIETFGRDDIRGKLLILGAAGVGKTIALLSLAEQLVEGAISNPKTVLPVLFELSTWRNDNQSIQAWLIDQLYDLHGGNRKSKLYEQWLEQQVLLPLLDGLDELGLERQKKCTKRIDEFSAYYPQLVVCCRVKEFETVDIKLRNLRGSVCFHSLLSDSQIQAYFDSLKRPELWGVIQTMPYLQAMLEPNIDGDPGLLRVPLFVKLVADVYDPQQPISSKADLLNKYIDRQLSFDKRNEDRRKELNQYKWSYKTVEQEPDWKQTRSHLSWLARNLKSNNMLEFIVEQIQWNSSKLRFFRGGLPWNFTRFLDYCVERRLLLRVGRSYRFIHHEFLDYFARLS
jgi:NACHT domain